MKKSVIKIKKPIKTTVLKEKSKNKVLKQIFAKKTKKEIIVKKKGNPDIKKFIDFFFEAAQKIKKTKPVITHGKDGVLTKLALNKLSLSQMEQLALWFFTKKQGLSLTIGAMLSRKVLDGLKYDMERPDFFKEIDAIYSEYFKSASDNGFAAKLEEKFRPFNSRQITEMQEQIARLERLVKRGIH